MLDDFAKTKHGFISILILSSIIGWIATYHDEKLLLEEVSTLSLLLYETITLLLVILLMAFISKPARKTIASTIHKIDGKTFLLLCFFSLVGVGLSFTGDFILKHHGTAKVRFGEVITSFIITGTIYLFLERNNFNIKKLLFFLTMLGGAIGFVIND
ncbi:MAG: hypothetical protein CMI79_06755 [Candidatus Pelagibacter sp.]|nr:hypothetical protein [Candidatus Pelagibacter sp.]|tara:strand:+ start:4727 stop:5197 length:471 start_codon:yes stop_codon:yes gene_type:complete